MKRNSDMRRYLPYAVAPALLIAGYALAHYPIMEMVADNVVKKYQTSTCEQLWQEKMKPKSPKEKEMVQLLRGDPQMRTAFINRIAAPVVNKMFECGMIP